jgi:tRNA threonylcarbamoyl adenosine modification protein (Sua5/YciO/YrdC/YwlC family)
MTTEAQALERCISEGGVAVFPSDTVYGLACDPADPAAVERMYGLKRRELGKPSAIMFFSLAAALPQLGFVGQRTRAALRRLLPGGVTLLLPNPDHNFPLAAGEQGAALGVRVPDVPALAEVRCPVLQSSANLAGGADARRLDEVPADLREGADLVIDGGELPGTPSTVVDLIRYEHEGEWSVLRAGAVGEEEVRRALEWQFHFDPDTYEREIRSEVADYDRLQDELLAASGSGARRILELGSGTGTTTLRLLERHPQASLVGIDVSDAMLGAARERLPAERVELRVGRAQDELPPGPFDLVASALCVHHLDAQEKAQLFRRLRSALAPGGRVVIADVVVPADRRQARVPLTPGYDKPSSVADQLHWMAVAGLEPQLVWEEGDLAVFVGAAPSAGIVAGR